MKRNVDTVTHTCTYTDTCTHTQIQTQTQTRTHTHGNKPGRMQMCTDTCTDRDTCTYTYTDTCTDTVTCMPTPVLLRSHVELLINKSPGAVQPRFGGNNARTTSQIFPKRWSWFHSISDNDLNIYTRAHSRPRANLFTCPHTLFIHSFIWTSLSPLLSSRWIINITHRQESFAAKPAHICRSKRSVWLVNTMCIWFDQNQIFLLKIFKYN